jgi:hypothetical protein
MLLKLRDEGFYLPAAAVALSSRSSCQPIAATYWGLCVPKILVRMI